MTKYSLRQLIYQVYKLCIWLPALFDKKFLHADVQEPKNVAHEHYLEYLINLADRPGMRVLEIGSRAVTGDASHRKLFRHCEYIGLDIHPGPNVDEVGDAHQLSELFEKESFDLVFSSAVFEHLAMPWVVAEEIAKILKVGGYVFVETHFSFCSHERPWHFFQFSDQALNILFAPHLGFECRDKGMSNPMVGRFSKEAAAYLRYKPISGLYCHSEYLGQKVRQPHEQKNWSNLKLQDVVGSTMYPEPEQPKSEG